jgi:hypothetical protein
VGETFTKQPNLDDDSIFNKYQEAIKELLREEFFPPAAKDPEVS